MPGWAAGKLCKVLADIVAMLAALRAIGKLPESLPAPMRLGPR
jgi:hypothetical protein